VIPPEPSLDVVTDTIEFAIAETPRFHPVSISGYHIREAGSTAAQEAAFTLTDGFAYVEACLDHGLDVDDFAPLLSSFFIRTNRCSMRPRSSGHHVASTPA
jgi:methylmalonyl-CoA mutase N-terminal domain/subunit